MKTYIKSLIYSYLKISMIFLVEISKTFNIFAISPFILRIPPLMLPFKELLIFHQFLLMQQSKLKKLLKPLYGIFILAASALIFSFTGEKPYLYPSVSFTHLPAEHPVKDDRSFFFTKRELYDSLGLESLGLSRSVFDLALKGMEKLLTLNKLQANILSIADFSKPSTFKRLYVIDLDQSVLLFNTFVAHGRNTGTEWAQQFSNKPKSKKSSLGFFVTGNTYKGSNGYSLKLMGMEKGFNSNAYQRAIVVHGADYVGERNIQELGYLGRSQGCPAVMPEISAPLINTIKDGTCFFIYHPSPNYLQHSTLLN
jgi:hypothetical protein